MVELHSRGLLAVHRGASAKVLLVAHGGLRRSGRADGIRRVVGRGPRSVAVGVVHAGGCLRALGAARVDAGEAWAQTVAGSWRRGQNTGGRGTATIGEGAGEGKI